MKPISKRLFSLLLAVIVVLGLPFTAMAATEPDSSQASGDLPLEWQIISDNLPDPIPGYDPHDPDNPYPYGVPVDTFYPIEEIDPYAVAPAALDQSYIPEEMRDNAILRALEYTGYDVQYLKKNGYLYVRQYIGSSLKTNAPKVLSDIGYWSTGACPNGDETVADSSTVTGRAPKLSYFESNGLVCASFVTYYLCNYLPNIEGVDTSAIYEKAKEMGADTSNSSLYYLTTVTTWKRTLDALASESGSGVTKYTDETKAYKNLVPGDVIVFASEGTLKHIAIYAGACDFYSTNGSNSGERHFIIHVGNSRGPEINTVEAMGSAGAKESEPIAWYHIDLPKAPTSGYIEVNKKDPDGKKLSGATFTAVNQSTKESFVIGPTNASGYAKSGELPLGTYVVTETVFPAGYEASGQSSWTVTLTEDTPNMTITINAVNKLSKGTAKIVKATTNGGTKEGWHFEVKNSGGTVVGTYVTDASGVIAVDLVPGTYTVTETDGARKYWVNDPNPSRTVTVKANETASVTFTNQWRGQAQIVKTATNGGTVAGWHFTVKNSGGTVVGNYVTDSSGVITLDLEPGTYTVTETDGPKQYWENDPNPTRTVTVKAGETAKVTFRNQYRGVAQIIKTATNGGTVAGWHFEVTDSGGTVIGNYVTDSSGIITVDLEPGTYTVTEVEGENPYWQNDPNPSKTVTVKAGQTAKVTFTNKYLGRAQIIKTATNGGSVAGWHFEVKDSSGTVIGNYVTGDTGIITLSLEPGTYTVTETDGEKEYWEKDSNPTRTVTVKAGQLAKVTFTNKWVGRAKIVKKATNGGTVAGWVFTIKKPDGTLVGKYTTGADGVILTNLEPGTYTVQENPVNDPYWVCDDSLKTITVKAGETASVSFQNRYIGMAKIIKTLEDPTSGTVEGWSFEIKASNGTVIGTYNTDASGTILCELEPGQYTVTELLDQDSYWECAGPLSQTVTVKAGQTAKVTFTNRLKPAEIIAYKIDVLGAPLPGAEFLLEWSEDGQSWKPVTYRASGNVTKGTCTSRGLVDGKLESGRDGVVHFTGLHPQLQYRLTETKAPEGYQLLEKPAYEGGIAPGEKLIVERTVVNAPVFELPMTGSTGSTTATILQLAGAVTLLAMLLYLVKKRR